MNFFNQSLWLDEATTALVAKMPIQDIVTKFLPGDFHPPLYYLLMHYWVSIFGNSEIALRIPSYIFALTTIYTVYKLSGKIPALLLATSGLFVYYAGEARMYMLAPFFVTWAVYTFIKKRWLVFSLLLAAIGMTDYVALFVLPVFWMAGLKSWKKIGISHIPLLIAYIFWLPILTKQLSYGLVASRTNWGSILGGVTVKNILLIPVKFLIGRVSLDDKIVYSVGVAIIGLLFVYVLHKVKNAPKIFWYWLVIPIIIGILISFKIPTLTYFRYLFVLPSLYLLVGYSKASKYMVWLLVGVNVICTLYYVASPKFYREDWRSLATSLGSEKIVFPAQTQKEGLIYYGKGSQIVNPNELSKNDQEIWLSRYVWEIFDPADSTRAKIEALGYNRIAEYNFNGVEVWKYQR